MAVRRPVAACAALVAAVAVAACVRVTEGVPVAGAPLNGSAAPSTIPGPPRFDPGPPGVVPTSRVALPAGGVTCAPAPGPGTTVSAEVADPKAPKLVVPVPADWTSATGSGDVAVTMDGPDGRTASVTIAKTRLDAEEAFRAHTDRLVDKGAVSTVSIMPAELCDYSGQKLVGAWSDTAANSVEFTDRIVHVWTAAENYLVAIHVEAPTGARPDDAATAMLTDDVELHVP